MNRAMIEYLDSSCSVIEDNGRARIVRITKNNDDNTLDKVNPIFFCENDLEELNNKLLSLKKELNKSHRKTYLNILKKTFYALIGYPCILFVALICVKSEILLMDFIMTALISGGIIVAGGLGSSLVTLLDNRYKKKETNKEINEIEDKIAKKEKELNYLKETYGFEETIINNDVMSQELASELSGAIKEHANEIRPFAINYLNSLRQSVYDYYIPSDIGENPEIRQIMR